MNLRSIVVLLTLLAAAACSEPLEFADWTVPVPDGTRIVEYAHVPLEGRTERVELIEDLVIGRGSDDPRYSFYQAWGLAVDARGNMYVMESGNHRIQVFDPEGQYLRTLGSEGQGPGELQEPMAIAVTGDTVVVIDPRNGRFNYWSVDGEYVGSSLLAERSLMTAGGLTDGTMVGSFVIFHRDPEFWREWVYARFARDGTELQRYSIFRARPSVSVMVPYNTPRIVATPGGDVYFTRSLQYQVHAFSAEGDHRWALRTTWPTPEVPQEIFDNAIERLRERQPDYEPPLDRWPDRMPAIGNMTIDGRGNLYVFPYRFVPRDPMGQPLLDTPDEVAVDVYSPDGELLSAALIGVTGWSAASGDYVYSLGVDPETEEEVLRRYRLVLPGER